MTPGLKRGIWILNTCGLLFFLAWLYTMSDKPILREQDGIIYFLPVIPFFFVYLSLIEPKPKPPPEEPPASEEPAAGTKPPPPEA